MCGITGVWNRDRGRHTDPTLLDRMVATLHHRGPDDRGTWSAGGAALGAARLSIVDLEGGHQPVLNENGTVVAAQNGEIYNHADLRRQLEADGHRFRSRVDTEVLVHGYEAWGPRGLAERLEGMFAVAVYDAAAHRLVLIRDRLGVKPLYYHAGPAGHAGPAQVVFGSEVKAVLEHPAVPRRLDPEGVDLFLTFEFTPAPRTLLADVRKLEPATLLVVDDSGARHECYWQLPPSGTGPAPTPDDAAARILELLTRSVKDRLMADVPLGALLSGGIDSSTVVSRMAALEVKPLSTFSVGFREPTYDESANAERIAACFGTEHHAAGLVPRAVELVERLMPFMDDPIGDFSIFPTYLVSRLARQKVKVVLSGDGGDEVFGGYDTYLAQKFARFPDRLPAVVHRAASRLGRIMPPREAKKGAWNLARRFLEGFGHPRAMGHMRWMAFTGAADKAEAYGPALRTGFDPVSVLDETLGDEASMDPVERSLRLDLKLYLPENILLKVDRMSMANSLEARVPLLDHRLVEYVAGLPSGFKVHGVDRKWILKRAVGGTVPPEVLTRKKSGFGIPMKTWLRTDLRGMVEALARGRIVRDHGLIREVYVRRLVSEHTNGRADHAHRLWPLVMLEQWVARTLGVGDRNRDPLGEQA